MAHTYLPILYDNVKLGNLKLPVKLPPASTHSWWFRVPICQSPVLSVLPNNQKVLNKHESKWRWLEGSHLDLPPRRSGFESPSRREICEVYPGLGILQPQWNPYPNLHPASYWDPPIVQSWPSVWFGSLSPLTAKWQATSAAEPNLRVTSTQLGWVSNDGNPSHTPTFPLHFFHRWRPSGGSWCCTTTH